MLYTFSQADYAPALLAGYLQHTNAQDAILLWQEGVLLALKYPDLFAQATAPCYALDLDLQARGLSSLIPASIHLCSMAEVVKLSEDYFPQFAL